MYCLPYFVGLVIIVVHLSLTQCIPALHKPRVLKTTASISVSIFCLSKNRIYLISEFNTIVILSDNREYWFEVS